MMADSIAYADDASSAAEENLLGAIGGYCATRLESLSEGGNVQGCTIHDGLGEGLASALGGWGDLMTSAADATTAIGASLRSTDATLAQRYDRMAGEAAQ
ncbi:hypothetical protein [Olsenella uli]|uniref:hypothetical protein n=1 Tax=Olsenella uli TaxID=133926 RepID=UPI0028E763D6|nr:hypothetical protein [Olsenella uli]